MTASEGRTRFVREVLPLEAAWMQLLRRSLVDKNDIDDVRQDIYVRLFETARNEVPEPVRPFVFTVARNLVIDRLRKVDVVPIDVVADLDTLGIEGEEPPADKKVIAREDLARLKRGLDLLSPRARETVVSR